VSATIIQIRDYQPKKTDAELREQAQRILAMSLDPSMIGAEFSADTAPCEYVAPDKDPA
jgi:hypothetical protein